ncbi:MAG: ATP-binding cassette domain-containing protein [Clostridia bacterium]|nr:ATP-binding cassette domain-containing protein [Clostridia bacterium]
MILELREIEKSFGEKKVLQGVSFYAESGKAFGLLGRNGAGKTTSIRILMDVFKADKGEVLIDGKPINHSALKIGYLPEERGLYPKKKIIDQLVYFAELNGMSSKQAVSSVDNWLSRLGMTEYRNKRLDTLSKGNQQKIQLITAIAHDPQIVILDEPFSGLDPVNARMLKSVVKNIISRDRIVLFSSHQMNYIEEFCDRIAIIDEGKVVLHGDLRDIKRAYVRDKLSVRAERTDIIRAAMPEMCSDGERGELIVRLPSPGDKKEVMEKLLSLCDIDEIKVYEPSLNDIFVEYTDKTSKEDSNEAI